MLISVHVLPRCSKNQILGPFADGTYKIKLKAPPVDGAANEALIDFLSDNFGVSKSQITIKRGLRGKRKVVEIL